MVQGWANAGLEILKRRVNTILVNAGISRAGRLLKTCVETAGGEFV